uniref:RRM domain-containing protein n=1 Tax=Gadus morhua TaxID=8049 RepID=A0A8C5BWB8_GADMO
MWSSIPTPFHVVVNPYLYDHTTHGFAVAVPCQMIPYNNPVFIDSLAVPGSIDHREVECLPNTVRESLDLLDHSEDVWAMQQVPQNSKAEGWQEESGNAALYEDSSAQASSSLNAGLEQHFYWGAPWQAPQSPPSQAQRWGPSACTVTGCSYDSPYSLDGSQPSTTKLNPFAAIYAMVPKQDSPALAMATETARCERSSPGARGPPCPSSTPKVVHPLRGSSPLFPRQAGRRGDPIQGSVASCKADVPEMDQEESSDFHSFLEDDENIVSDERSSRPRAGAGRERSAGAGGEAPHTVERGTSPSPRVVTSDVSVGTETRCVSVEAQTKVPAMADQNHLTMLQMSDLDYLAEEIVKLKSAKKELDELRQKLKSSEEAGDRVPCEGFCRRAQCAELCLLDLHYTMCQQQAWRDCFTSPDDLAMRTAHSEPKDPPAKLVNVCEKLQCDYKEMRTKILAGVTLEQLEPLFVSSARLTSGCPYGPPKLIGDALEDVATSSRPLEGWDLEMHGGKECPLFPKSEDPKEAKRRNAPVAHSTVKRRRAVSLTLKHSGTDNKQTVDRVTEVVVVESQMEGDSTELSTGEVWYDAKEDPEPAVVMVPTGQGDTHSGSDEEIKEGLPKKVEEQGSSLVISGLPKDVTESDVMQWFEKDHVSDVRFFIFSNHLRVAMVTIKGPLAAEFAVGKMNGVCVPGSTLHVGHIRPVTESLSPALQIPVASSKVPEETGGATKPSANKTHSSLTVGKVPGSDKHEVLSDSPTAEGTCVPQHHASMGSFDKLMVALKERHPEAGRLAIVGALQEMKTRHRGSLSGLPLSSIVEVASKQLAAMSSSGATAASGGSR